MGGRGTATLRRGSTSFWHSLKHGPWPEPVIDRLIGALDALVQRLRASREVAGLILFGSYARGDFGRKSDVDLLILFEAVASPETAAAGRAAIRQVGEVELEARLPMHLAPLLASVEQPETLGADLLHDIWRDGQVLYARAAALAFLQPDGLTPWALIRFSAARASPRERVRLSRRLHGMAGRPGLVHPPSLTLGPGTLLVAASQAQAVRTALEEAGAAYDVLPVWRAT